MLREGTSRKRCVPPWAPSVPTHLPPQSWSPCGPLSFPTGQSVSWVPARDAYRPLPHPQCGSGRQDTWSTWRGEVVAHWGNLGGCEDMGRVALEPASSRPPPSLADEDVCVFKCSVSRETECSRVGKQSFIITLGCNSVLLQFATPSGTCPFCPAAHGVPRAGEPRLPAWLGGTWSWGESESGHLTQRMTHPH